MIPFLIILIIFFNNIIGRVLPTNLIDEALTALIVLGGCLRILELRKRRSIQKTDIVVVILTAIMVLLGLLSTLVYRHQTGLVPIIKDMMALVKMPLVFAFGSYVFDHLDVDLLYIRTLKLVKASTVIIFICGVLNGVFPMGMDCGYRHGVKTFQFLFSHPTFLVYCLVLFICLLFLEKPFSKYILMNLLSMIFTFRDKAYFFVILYVGIFFFMKLKKKLWRILYVVGGGTAGLAAVYVLSYDKLVNEYLVWGDRTARGAFYIYGLDQAYHNFPLGTGFATWGTSAAGEYYSSLYYQHNMQYIPGIMPDDISYATDTFWPAIYTQLGVIGFLLYVIILVLIFRYFFMQNKEQERFLWAGMLLLLYGLMASVFEAFYTNDSGVFTIIFMMLLMRSRQYSSDTLFETEKEHE